MTWLYKKPQHQKPWYWPVHCIGVLITSSEMIRKCSTHKLNIMAADALTMQGTGAKVGMVLFCFKYSGVLWHIFITISWLLKSWQWEKPGYWYPWYQFSLAQIILGPTLSCDYNIMAAGVLVMQGARGLVVLLTIFWGPHTIRSSRTSMS